MLVNTKLRKLLYIRKTTHGRWPTLVGIEKRLELVNLGVILLEEWRMGLCDSATVKLTSRYLWLVVDLHCATAGPD